MAKTVGERVMFWFGLFTGAGGYAFIDKTTGYGSQATDRLIEHLRSLMEVVVVLLA